MIATRFLWLLALVSGLAMATNIDGTITYQAQIKQNGAPANGTFDFQFKLFDNATVGSGVQHGLTVPVNDVAISNGALSTNLNFDTPGSPFDGTQLFLEIGIRPGNSQQNDPYTLLNPRQRLTEVPYATHTVVSELALTVPNGSITSVQLAANSVGSSNIIDGSVGNADLAAGAVTAAKIDTSTVQKRVTPGCAAGTAVQSVNQDGTVACVAISGGGGGGTVTSVGAGAGLTTGGSPITTSGVIGIANQGVTNAMIADATITGAKIAAATITGADIAAGTITNTNINTSLVQQRVAGTCAGSAFVQTIGADGSVTCATAGSGGGSGWGLTGNAGTSPASNFVGTTDNQAFIIRTNNQRAAQFQMVTDTSNDVGVNVLLGSAANTISSGVTAATIGGGGFSAPAGQTNSVTANAGTISGGFQNSVHALGGAIGGGFTNMAGGQAAVVAGGSQNNASSNFATIAGGTANTASGQFSTVLGGKGNVAAASYSTTIGSCASVASADTGAIVISARTAGTCSPVGSNGVNTVTVSAGSGGVVLAQGSGSWSNLSDRNTKHAVTPVDAGSILAGVLAVPIATWTYNTQSDGIRHMGPMAQDFYAAFNLGEDEKRINSVDADGVALAAIQGLNAKLERENDALKAKNAELESRLERIEQTLLGTSGQARR